jgi:quercetin dioxygenase-like cupin family protein
MGWKSIVMEPRIVVGASLTALVLSTSACASSATSAAASRSAAPTVTASPSATASAAVPVLREVLDNDTTPPGAPGRTLSLVRYTIAPGAKLAPHVHPGVQMASIASGTLTYTVVSGVAEVRRAGATTDTPVKGPMTTQLGPGDAVIEVGNMVHFGENKTKQPIIILATLLTLDGHPLAEPVKIP